MAVRVHFACDDTKVDRLPDAAGSVDVGGYLRKLDPNGKSRRARRERRRIIALDISDLVRRWHRGELPNHGVLLKLAGRGTAASARASSSTTPTGPRSSSPATAPVRRRCATRRSRGVQLSAPRVAA